MKKYVIDNPVETGSLIRENRNKIHLTLAELAAVVGVSLGTVQQWESGRRSVSSRFIPRLLSILKVSAADLGICETEITPENESPVTESTFTVPDDTEPFHSLAACFEALNDDGKAELLRFAEMLCTHPNYRV